MTFGETIYLETPLTRDTLNFLRSGDQVQIFGVIYTARDAAHERMWKAIQQGRELPFDPTGQIIYYVGPTPPPPGRIIGSAGPTTASRMDPFTPMLIERGLKGMIGKGRRSEKVRQAAITHGCVYFGSIEGTAALLSGCIQEAEVVAFEDLGPEAVYRLTVSGFPAVVVNDLFGRDLYEDGRRLYRRSR
ncbi:MAG: FumA C-terminus/TtdB family hydratase beta subunit [Desulfobacterales bacterium]|jgi:fumarate hydratase subunit beta